MQRFNYCKFFTLLLPALVIGLVLAVLISINPLPKAQADGLSWTIANTPSGTATVTKIVYGSGSALVAMATTGNILASSDGGAIWNTVSTGVSSPSDIISDGANFYAVGAVDEGNGKYIRTSSDGVNWSSVTTGITGSYNILGAAGVGTQIGNVYLFSASDGSILELSEGGWHILNQAGYYYRAYTGNQWIYVYSQDSFYGLSPAGQINVLSRNIGSNYYGSFSPEGDWTYAHSFTSLSYEGSMGTPTFYATENSGNNYGALYSSSPYPDRWTLVDTYSYPIAETFGNGSSGPVSTITNNTNFNDVIYAGGTFVAVGNRGTIETSTDGSTWSPCVSGTTQDLETVTYINGTFLVGGANETILRSGSGSTPQQAPALNTTPTAAPGSAYGTTAVTAAPNTATDTFAVEVSATSIAAPNVGDPAPTGAGVANPYTSGGSISAASGNYAGVYELTSATGTVVAFSQIHLTSSDILPGAAAQLAWQTQPGGAASGEALNPQPALMLEDAVGNLERGDNTDTVTVALTAASGAALSGTETVTVSGGIATFSGLSVDKAGSYTLTATSGSITSQASDSFSITASPVNNTGSGTITPSVGGTVALGSAASVNIPAGAVSGSAAVTVTVASAPSPPVAPAGYTIVGSYEFTVNGSGYTFSSPVTLTFTFDPSLIPAGTTPAVYYYDGTTSQWVLVTGGAVNYTNDTITVTVSHFTTFAVMAQTVITGGGGGGAVLFTPRPCRQRLPRRSQPAPLS